MRISSLQIFNIANNSMADANSAMIKTQEQISSGKRVLTPSDDPVAASRMLQLGDELATVSQYNKNIDLAKDSLEAEESILSGVGNLLDRMKELAVHAGNSATLSANDYRTLAAEVDSRVQELQAMLNTRNANGDYIFGGYKSNGEPFTGNAESGFVYNGDEGQRRIKIANNTTIESTDSGKALFVDIQSAHHTINTYASPANTSNPPVRVSVGQVVDQEAYDEFYPEDIVISFNAESNINPPGKNFTATEKSTGRIIVADQPYTSGTEIELKGVSLKIIGQPVSGTASTPATRIFGADATPVFPADFTAPADETFSITVAGRTRTFTLDANITNTTDLSNVLNSTVNGNSAALADLGLVVDGTGIRMPAGINFSMSGGSANIDNVLGLNTSAGTASSDGVLATTGDKVFVDSSNKQDVLTTLARFSEAMKSLDGTAESRESLENVVASTLDNLGHTQTSILDVVSKIGARYNTLDGTKSQHQDTQVITEKVLSGLRDIDYAEAATRLSAQSLVLQAAQSSFIRVSRLTLFSQL